MSRTPFVCGNWKMWGTISEGRRLVEAVLPRVEEPRDVEVAVAVPYTALTAVVEAAHDSDVEVFAQNMHDAEGGPYTGEVSARMLCEVGIDGVILGHSERRQLFGETDRALQRKVPIALENDLRPILCVGESEDERERGDTERKLRSQVQEGLHDVPTERLHEVVIAYEPIWAIGTGRVATPEQAQEAVAFVRALVADRSREAGERVRVLYGGSVKPDNAEELMGLPDVDGALVGGASLEADSFCAIVAAAGR
jgi:triosephosphate isomerase (TIM)